MKSNFFNLLVFLGVVIVVFLQPVLLKIYGLHNQFLNILDDVVYFLFIALLLPNINKLTSERYLYRILFSFLMFILLGVASALLLNYSKSVMQIFFQVVLDFKLIVFFLILFQYKPFEKEILWFEKILKIFLIVSLPLSLIQYLSPGIFNTYFTNEQSDEYFTTGGLELPRLMGLFPLAGSAAFFFSIALFYFHYVKKSNFFALLSFVELIATLQRQEIATFLFLIWLLNVKKYNGLVRFSVPSAIVLICLFFFSDNLSNYGSYLFTSLQLDDINRSEDPRVLIYINGISLALHYFPFGVGFGNFGGFAAAKFDSILYYELNFHQIDWFKEKDYLTDTYYPHLFAESGLLGFLFYLFCLLYLRSFFVHSLHQKTNVSYILFLFSFLYIITLTAPALNNPFSICMIGIVISIIRKNDTQNG